MKQWFNTNNEMTISLNNSMSHIPPQIPCKAMQPPGQCQHAVFQGEYVRLDYSTMDV